MNITGLASLLALGPLLLAVLGGCYGSDSGSSSSSPGEPCIPSSPGSGTDPGCEPEFYCSEEFLPETCPSAVEGCCLLRCTDPGGNECPNGENCVDSPDIGGVCI